MLYFLYSTLLQVCVCVCACTRTNVRRYLSYCKAVALSPVHNTGAVPYPDLSNQEVVTKVIAGYRMKKPNNCSEKM